MNLSFWEQQTFLSNIDCLIIGSGIVGLNAAITFKEKYPSSKVVIVERGTLPSGASTRNAGFACFGSISELLDDFNTMSETAVLDLVAQRWGGLRRLRERVGDNNLGYKGYGNYELFSDKDDMLFKDCRDKIAFLNKKIAPITGIENTYSVVDNQIQSFGFHQTKHLILNQAEGQINTGQMMQQLLFIAQSKGVQILNGVTVTKIEDDSKEVTIQTKNNWTIKAAKVIVATNGFAKQLLPALPVTTVRNQVLITKPIQQLAIKGCFHYDKGYYYFRNVGNRILFGGGRNLDLEGETTDQFGLTKLIQENLTRFLKTIILPNQAIEIEQWWSGILGVGDSKSPILKKHSGNVVLAVRLGGMGVAIGSLLGESSIQVMKG